MTAAAHVREPGREPVEIRAQRLVTDVGPGRACSLAAVVPSCEHESRLERARLLRPWKYADAHFADALHQCGGDACVVGVLEPALVELESTEPALVLRDHSLLTAVPL